MLFKRTARRLRCSFCGKSEHEVQALIAGPKVHICNECVGHCNDILTETAAKQGAPTAPPLH